MSLHHVLLVERAQQLGITCEDLTEAWNEEAVLMTYQNHSELIFWGRSYSFLSHHQALICKNKHLTKRILGELGIPAPPSIVFRDPEGDRAAIDAFWDPEKTYVCKPLHGSKGHGVWMNIRDRQTLAEHHRAFRIWYDAFLLEEQVGGYDLRIQAIGGKIVAACTRRPASVIGDGIHTLEELITLRREEIRLQNPNNKLEIDADTEELMQKQQVRLDTIPAQGREIQLKYVSNMGKGGRAVDVTDTLHPDYQAWIDRIEHRLGLNIFALDAFTDDHTGDPAVFTTALEINRDPQWLHHTFSDGRTHDMPRLILEELFGLKDE